MKPFALIRKRFGMACGAVFAVVFIVLAAAWARTDGSFEPSAVTEKAASGRELYDEIMGRYPELRGKATFDGAEGESKGSSRRTNRMRLPVYEWNALDQGEQNLLAQFLESMGPKWRIEVGELSEDGLRIVSPKPVVTSREWHEKIK